MLLLGRNAGQREVGDSGAHKGLCREVWQIQQQLNGEPISLYFLVIARDGRGHQLWDTLYVFTSADQSTLQGYSKVIFMHINIET